MRNKTYIISKLKNEACKSLVYTKHAACIILNGKIISINRNEYLYNGIADNKFTIHAEVNALLNLPTKYKNMNGKLILYVIRVNNENKLCLSKPCKNCSNIIKKYNIHSVYYSV